MKTSTDNLARKLADAATRKDAMHLNKAMVDELIKGIAQGFGPEIQNYVRLELAKALVPLQAEIDEIEAELREVRNAGR